MRKFVTHTVSLLLCFYLLPLSIFGKELIPVGQVVGLELQDNIVTVVGVDAKMAQETKATALQEGDQILEIDGKKIMSAQNIRDALVRSDGSVTVTIRRSGKQQEYALWPMITSDGPKLGLYLRQGITGIGTVTYYDPETKMFGTLGHGVNNSKGQILSLTQGAAYPACVMNVRKGVSGNPGQLMGTIESKTPIGVLTKNTQQGVFGTSEKGWQGQAITVAKAEEIKTGYATIRSTVDGNTVREYSVEILKIYPKAKINGRNLLLRITDPALLQATGGIVQGMSGSPIIQDGKLVGAVTHVLVNDPTTGYGIFIENMLDAAA